MVVHLLVLIRVLEVVGAAIGGIETCQVEVAASLARSLAIALYLSTFAFVAIIDLVLVQVVSGSSLVVARTTSIRETWRGHCPQSPSSILQQADYWSTLVYNMGYTYHAIEIYCAVRTSVSKIDGQWASAAHDRAPRQEQLQHIPYSSWTSGPFRSRRLHQPCVYRRRCGRHRLRLSRRLLCQKQRVMAGRNCLRVRKAASLDGRWDDVERLQSGHRCQAQALQEQDASETSASR